MSFDRKLDWTCPHTVAGEAIFINNDRVTVRPLRPISAINSLKIRMNGEVSVPPDGHKTAAQAIGTKTGPFNVEFGQNTLVLRIGNSAAQTITITPGTRLSASRVAGALSDAAPSLLFDVTPKQQIRVRTRQQGRSATLFIVSGGLAATLGLTTNKQWRGKLVYPGWSLIRDPNTLDDRPTRLVVFDEPLRGYRDFVELNYATIREECRRCGGIGIEHDWRYDRSGDVVKVRDQALLEQEFLKAIFTLKGSNRFNRWYGTRILDAIGQKQTPNGLLGNLIVADIQEAFRRWQEIKRRQEALPQLVSDEEFPFNLLEAYLEPSQEDPTVIFVHATIQSRATDKPLHIERGVRIPQD